MGSQAKLIAGGLAPGAEIDIYPWVDEVARLGGLGLVDGLGMHPYSSAAPDDPRSWIMGLEALHTHLAELGSPDLPLWLTEYGAPVSTVSSGYGPPLGEQEQAERLRVAFALVTRLPYVANMTWYEYSDSCSDATDAECRFGLVRKDLSPRPSYYALQEVIAGRLPRLRPRLALSSWVRATPKARARPLHLWARSAGRLRRSRPGGYGVTVSGTLRLPGTSIVNGRIGLRIRRPGKRPYSVSVTVSNGVFRTHLRRRDDRRWTVEARYPGTESYEPAVARVRVGGGEILRQGRSG